MFWSNYFTRFSNNPIFRKIYSRDFILDIFPIVFYSFKFKDFWKKINVIHDYLLKEYADNINIKIFWLNEHKESFEPYDILLLEDNHPIFIEVKPTITSSRSFTISHIREGIKFGKEIRERSYFICRHKCWEFKCFLL